MLQIIYVAIFWNVRIKAARARNFDPYFAKNNMNRNWISASESTSKLVKPLRQICLLIKPFKLLLYHVRLFKQQLCFTFRIHRVVL